MFGSFFHRAQFKSEAEDVKKYVRAANYISAAQIYLQDNVLLDRPLAFEDIKPRLLGHWGTCPGINLVYGSLNWLIKKHNLDMLFVLGPGHGFPALQANLFLEGTLEKYYSKASRTKEGLLHICKNFSWPYGFPSHSNPGTPGVILEGGELGYSLSTSYGAVLDNPDLIATCLVGDGEAETGPTAGAWHINKLIDPSENGTVLPILHLNGYKISGPTIYGRMSDAELKSLFTGYGYKPHLVTYSEYIFEDLLSTLEDCYCEIQAIKDRARKGEKIIAPQFPMIVLRTPKGWTGIKDLDGEKLEGNCASHQVIAKDAKTNDEHLQALDQWLRSYSFKDLFDEKTGFSQEILENLPSAELVMGDNKHTMGGERAYKPLILPDATKYVEDATVPGTIGSSSMRRAGDYLNDVFKLNAESKNFRLMSPDETYSNKLDKVFETTSRAFVWPHMDWDKDLASNGRVMEMLSEHSLQGLMQGYVLSGRHAVFASYEAFIQIVSSMADQYSKFLRYARLTSWRGNIASINYILTSSGWRQDHNGFSHQNPGFIDSILQKQGGFVNVYMPPDGNSTIAVLEKCLSSKNEINVIVAGKTLEPRWLTFNQAREELVRGMAIWEFASDPDPDIVMAAAGDYLTKEALAAVEIVKKEAPEIRVRFVNVMSLSELGMGNSGSRKPNDDFEEFFTDKKPVIFNFHGYPQTIKQILFDYGGDTNRFSIRGYEENGSTTTPFDMQIRNGTDRYNLAIEVFEKMAQKRVIPKKKKDLLKEKYQTMLREHRAYIEKNGVDPEPIDSWTWKKNT